MKKKIIQTNDYQGQDRRNGEMKLKDWFTPTTITTLIIALIAIVGYKFTLEATAETVKCQAVLISSLEDKTTETNNDVIRIDTNQKEVIKKVDKILENQDGMVKLLVRLETKIEKIQ